MVVATSIIAGASGGALANVALSPLGGGAGFIQSYWYGAGLILGERDMYTFHWEKIKARLSAGEDYLSVLESEMNPAITAIANYSLQIMQKTGAIYIKGGIDFMAQLIENMFKIIAGETITEPVPEPVPEPVEPPLVECPSGFRWSDSAQQCVPEDIPEPTPVPEDPLIDDSSNPAWPTGASAFIPQSYNASNPVVTQAVARIDSVGTEFKIRIALTYDGTYANLWFDLDGKMYSSLTNALAVAFTAYPDNLYKVILVGVGAFIVRR